VPVGRRAAVRARRVQAVTGEPDPDRAGSADAAHAAALRLLTARARTRAELERRLVERGFAGEAVTSALDRLERVGLVDDAALAALVAEGRAEQGLDAPAIALELRDRGVDPGLAEAAAEAAAPADQRRERCRQVAEARLGQLGGLDPEARRRRLAGYLARRGYPPEIAEPVTRELVPLDRSGYLDRL
jgi:regulatory protein